MFQNKNQRQSLSTSSLKHAVERSDNRCWSKRESCSQCVLTVKLFTLEVTVREWKITYPLLKAVLTKPLGISCVCGPPTGF